MGIKDSIKGSIKDSFMLSIHTMLVLVAIAGILFLAVGEVIIALALLIPAWFINGHFKDRCLGFYIGRREDCSVDYVIPEIMHNGENINDGEIIDAEWEEIK